LDNLTHMIEGLLRFILYLGGIIVSAIVAIEYWLRDQLTQMHVPREAQSILLLLLAVALVAGALRLFGGIIRLALLLVLLLIAVDIVVPMVQR
jgi:hypothetical protein